tara:strand:- start:361 stop:564 length:204 start_codon:yes stop_codon:yes gene_type:complete
MQPYLLYAAILVGSTNTYAGMSRIDSMLMVRVGAAVLSCLLRRSYHVVYLSNDEGFVVTLPANGLIH